MKMELGKMALRYRISYYLTNPLEFLKDTIYYPIKYKILHIKHGFDVRDTWSLDYSIAKYTLPRLKLLRDNLHGHPCIEGDPYCETFEAWQNTVDRMIWSLQSIVDEADNWKEWHKQFELETEHEFFLDSKIKMKDVDYNKQRLHIEKRQEGLVLFGKYMEALWD